MLMRSLGECIPLCGKTVGKTGHCYSWVTPDNDVVTLCPASLLYRKGLLLTLFQLTFSFVLKKAHIITHICFQAIQICPPIGLFTRLNVVP